jgi:hypothetical protein
VTAWTEQSTSADHAQVFSVNLDDKTPKTHPLLRGYGVRYLEPGYLLFVRGTALIAVPFDKERVKVTGKEEIVMTGIFRQSNFGIVHGAYDRGGSAVFVMGDDLGIGRLAFTATEGTNSAFLQSEGEGWAYGPFDVTTGGEHFALQSAKHKQVGRRK